MDLTGLQFSTIRKLIAERRGLLCYKCRNLLKLRDGDQPQSAPIAQASYLIFPKEGGRMTLDNMILVCQICKVNRYRDRFKDEYKTSKKLWHASHKHLRKSKSKKKMQKLER